MRRTILSVCLIVSIFYSCQKDDSPAEPPVVSIPEEEVVLSAENLITSFEITLDGEVLQGNIDQVNRTITFNTAGADISSLVPTIMHSEKSTLSPAPDIPQNFDDEIAYTVIAENGDSNIYRVIINNRELSSDTSIQSFTITVNNEVIEADIDHSLQEIVFNVGSYDISAITPSIEISQYANIFPESGMTQDFNELTTYTVTAEDGGTAEYSLIINRPIINGIGGKYTNNPILFYTGAQLIVSGQFLDMDLENSELYLFDGNNKYPLEVSSQYQNTNNFINTSSIFVQIPSNVPTYADYHVVYEINGLKSTFETSIDVLAENAPNPISLNQEQYVRDDILIITGENLTDIITIPSNGSIFIIQNGKDYDLTVNPERTELRLTLDYYYLFPSYFARPQEEKVITLLGPDRRAGATITTTFK